MAFDPTTAYIAEAQGYPKEVLHKNAFRATRTCHVLWADRYNWANYFLYGIGASGDTNDYPYFVAEGIPTESAITAIGIEPDENSKLDHGTAAISQARYGHAHLTIAYEAAAFNLDEVYIEEIAPRSEQMSCYSFVGGLPVPDNIHVCGHSLTITYPMRKNVPTSVFSLNNMVNLDPYSPSMFPGIFFYPGCLLHISGYAKGALHYDGTTRYRVEHHLISRPWNWNYVWSPWTGGMVAADYSKYGYTPFGTQL